MNWEIALPPVAGIFVIALLKTTVSARAEHAQGQVILRYGWGYRAISILLITIPVLVTFFEFQSPSSDQLLTWCFIAIIWLVVLYMIGGTLFERIAFDETYIYTRIPWRKSKSIPWSDVKGMKFSGFNNSYIVRTKSYGRVIVHNGMNGWPELINEITARITARESPAK